MLEDVQFKQFNLLYVDDDRNVLADAYALFSSMFKATHIAHNAEFALSIFDKENIDIVITDIELSGENGLSLIDKLREKDPNITIIILTAHTRADYLLKAANSRIDGYIIKPLSFKKLLPTLKKAVERLLPATKTVDIAQSLTYNYSLKTLYVDDKKVSLGEKEAKLLELLLASQETLTNKSSIAATVWKNETMTESALKSLINELRKKLKYDVITTVPKHGWVLKND